MLETLATGKEAGVNFTLTGGFAVKSKDFNNADLIAAKFVGPSVEGKTGVWSSSILEPGKGLMVAVNGLPRIHRLAGR